MDVAAGHQRQAGGGGQGTQCGKPLAIIGLQVAFESDPAAFRKSPAQPLPIFLRGLGRGDPERQTIGNAAHQIAARQVIAPLVCAASAEGNDGAEIAVARAVFCQQNQFHAPGQNQFRADDQLESGLFRRHMRAHDTGDGTLVGDGQRRIAERLRLLDQLFRMRGAAQKAEVGDAVQFGVIG